MQWRHHLVCLCVVIVSLRGSPRNTRTSSISGTTGANDSNRTLSRNISSHAGVTEHSNTSRTLSPGNSTERRRRTHRVRKKQSKGFWTKAGTALTGVVQGYNILRNTFGGARNTRRRAGYYDDYESEDYSESEIKPKKRPRRLRAMEATTMSLVEEAYRRALTFTPRYQWDDKTTKRPQPPASVEDDAKVDSKSKKLDRRKGKRKSVASKKLKLENTPTRRPRGRGRGMRGKTKVTENLPSRVRPRIRKPEYVPRMPSSSFIRPILSTTGKVIRGLDTLAYYGSYFSYTILPMSIAAVETFKNLLPAPETVARIESSPPFATL